MNVRSLILALCLAGLANPRTSFAQPAISDPSQVLTKYLEPTTVAVVDINIEAIDLNTAMPWFYQMTGTKPDATVTGMATTVVASFRSAGVKHMYLIVGTQSFQGSAPLVVIPCQQPKNIEPFLAMFVQNFPPDAKLTTRLTDDMAMVGSLDTFNRLALAAPTPRPELLEPLSPSFVGVDVTKEGETPAPFANSHVKVVMSLAAEPRNQLITFWPEQLTINENLSVSPKQLVQDIDRIVARASIPPSEGVQVQIQTTSAAAAERTKQMLDNFSAIDPKMAAKIQRTVNDKVLTLFAPADFLNETLTTLAMQSRTQATEMERKNFLRQLGLAIHNYADAYQELPPRVFVDPAGKPLFGWTVALLPYLEQQALYSQLKLDQRWDSEANRVFTQMLIQVFGNDGQSGTKTTFRAPVYPGSLWEGEGAPRKFADITDGTSNTIALIDAPQSAAIEWADPTPWVISKDDPMKDVFGDRESVTCLFLDGSVRQFTKGELTNEKLGAMLTIAGGEVVE